MPATYRELPLMTLRDAARASHGSLRRSCVALISASLSHAFSFLASFAISTCWALISITRPSISPFSVSISRLSQAFAVMRLRIETRISVIMQYSHPMKLNWDICNYKDMDRSISYIFFSTYFFKYLYFPDSCQSIFSSEVFEVSIISRSFFDFSKIFLSIFCETFLL